MIYVILLLYFMGPIGYDILCLNYCSNMIVIPTNMHVQLLLLIIWVQYRTSSLSVNINPQ